MNEELYSKVNLKILASYFKQLRVEKGYSLRGVADAANLSHVIISDFENGRLYPNLETLVSIFHQLGISFCIDSDRLSHYKQTIEMLNEAIYYQNLDQIKLYSERLLEVDTLLRNSLLFLDYKLAIISYNISFKKQLDPTELLELESSYEHLTEQQKHRFNTIVGAMYYKLENPVKALQYLERNLNLFGNKKAHALTLTYLSRSFLHLFQISNTIHYGKEASALHAHFANFNRKITSDLMVARMLIEVGRYKQAHQIVSSIELTTNLEEHFDILQETRFLKSYILYRKKDFQQALTVLYQFPFKTTYVYFYEAMLYVRSNNIAKALDVLVKSLNQKIVKNDFVYSRVNQVAVYYYNQQFDHPNYEKLVLELMTNRFKISDVQVFRLVFEMLVTYYEYHKQYKKALETSKSYIQWTGRTTLFETNH